MTKRPNRFKSEKAEREFWQKNDSSNEVNWDDAKAVKFSNLKPSTKTISIRLPEALIADLKLLANKKDVPYQSLMKMILSAQVRSELHQL